MIIDLDRNKIKYGKLGPPPCLPDKRCRKLLQLIQVSAPVFDRRGRDWRESRLPLFDSAFTIVTDSAAMEYESTSEGGERGGGGGGSTGPGTSRYKEGEVNESAVRAGFLNFFVSVLKSYRK